MENSKKKIIYTIGHSTRDIEEFLLMLNNFRIECLVDVRRFPSSRKFPAYNQDNLRETLKNIGIEYVHIEALGGRRSALKNSPNSIWQLQVISTTKVTAIMCSEAVFWRCHRSMISDFLKSESYEVLHIMSPTKLTEHPYTAPAHIVDGKLTYHEVDTKD